MISDTDEELVEKVQEGDILAFETLVKRYEARLLRFVERIVENEKDAEEIIQDAFLNIYKKIDNIDTKRKFSSYLYTVGRNQAISFLRGKKKELPLKEEIVGSGTPNDVFERIEIVENQERINKALSFLSGRYRKVIKLYYFRELSYKEIGHELSIPINTVRTHLRRGRQMLRKVFENEKI